MESRRRLFGLLAGLAILCLMVPMATAGQYNIGGGLGIAPDYEGSDDYEVVPLPAGEAYFDNGMYIELLGLNLRANLILERWVSWLKAGPVYNYRPSRSNVDNSQVDDMRNVSDANELGAFVKFVYKNWHANIEYLADTGDAHDGEYAEFSGGYRWLFSDEWTFSFGAFTTWADTDYHETYFGVTPNDSLRSGLSTYDPDDGIKDVGVNLGANWKFASNWNLRGLLQIKQLVGDADDDSPVVDEGSETQLFTGLLILYSF
ncbi:MAG: MipA/OmpV family protein [Deltaproteobacteria bacterium]|nr:MipA/OmpV family protein [Deltaproteobacteria bacterium]